MNLSKENVKARIKQALIYVAVVAVLVVLDQLTKYWTVTLIGNRSIALIEGVLELTYVKNTGALWGLGQGYTWIFMVLTPVCIAFLVVLYLKTPIDKKFWLMRAVLAVVVAGAIGNFIDRAFVGYVVDMIYFKLIDFPVFNVADSYVTVGMFTLILFILFWKDLGDGLFGSSKK